MGNINALNWIWNKLRTEYGCKYLCTNPICQDCLENYFSEIRRRCGFNDAPNAFQFSSAFKYAMLSAASETFDEGKNCQNDGLQPLLNEEDLEELCTEAETTLAFEIEKLDLDTPFVAQRKELNALVYILGIAISKLPHEKCRAKLKATQDDECLQDDDYSFSKLKAQASSRNVDIPNNTLHAIGMIAFAAFKQKFRKFLFENRKGVKTRLKEYVTYEQFDSVVCKACFDRMIDFIYNTLIQGFLREVRFKNKVTENNKRKTKRNRKAVRMNLPQRA